MKPHMLALALLLPGAAAHAEVKALPPAQWPVTVANAVPRILATMSPTQKSIVGNTSKDNLPLFLGEWGEDIETLLGLNKGNKALAEAACARPCGAEQATLLLMEATWEALK